VLVTAVRESITLEGVFSVVTVMIRTSLILKILRYQEEWELNYLGKIFQHHHEYC